MIKLIVFDLWQTLAFRDVEYSTTSRMLEDSGSKIPKTEFVKIFERSLQTKKWESKFQAYKNLCKNMNLPTTRKNVLLLQKIRDRAEAKTKLFPYSIMVLKQLKKQGLKTALISNSSVFAVNQIKKTKLLNYIDFPLFSFQVGVIKPGKKFFKKILAISKCKPEEVVMIGDKEKDDIIPARELGMSTILFENFGQLKTGLARYNIRIK